MLFRSILQRINETAYRLRLPTHWQIHNAFHVSLLKPYKGEPPTEPILEDPPDIDQDKEILQPEVILRHEDKLLRSCKTLRKYLVKFKNYPYEDGRWTRKPNCRIPPLFWKVIGFPYELM